MDFLRRLTGMGNATDAELQAWHYNAAAGFKSIADLPRTPAQIVFVSDWPMSREAKLASALREAGWQVVLLYRNPPNFEPSKYFDSVQRYSAAVEALSQAASYHPVAYHVFSNWNFDVALTLITYKPGRIVFDNYDTLAGMVNEKEIDATVREQLLLERLCVENADGICCRSLETQLAKRKMGYRYKGRRIFFTDYCWGTNSSAETKRPISPLTVSNVGNIHIDPDHGIDDAHNFHLKVALLLARKNIRIILYKNHLDSRTVTFVGEASGFDPFIRVCHVPVEQLLDELLNLCDAGLICAPVELKDSAHQVYSDAKKTFAIGNKAFDYVDAGLAVVIGTESRFLYWLIKRYHKTLDYDLFMSDVDRGAASIREWQQADPGGPFDGCRRLSVRKQIPRLIRFYEQLA